MKGIREAKNFSLKELAKRSGISRSTLQEYEFGVTAPRIPNLIRLVEALEITCDYLMGLPKEDRYSFRVTASRLALFNLAVEASAGTGYYVSYVSDPVLNLASRRNAPVTVDGWRERKEIYHYKPFRKAKVLPWRPKQ